MPKQGPNKKAFVMKSKKVMDFIIDKMEDECLLVEQVCNKYPTQTPAVRNVYQWAADDPEFHARISQAYTVWLMSRIAELEYVSTAPASVLFPDLEDNKDRYEARRARIDALKFMLGKMAPVLSQRFQVKQQVEHTGDALVTYNIVNYKTADKELKPCLTTSSQLLEQS